MIRIKIPSHSGVAVYSGKSKVYATVMTKVLSVIASEVLVIDSVQQSEEHSRVSNCL